MADEELGRPEPEEEETQVEEGEPSSSDGIEDPIAEAPDNAASEAPSPDEGSNEAAAREQYRSEREGNARVLASTQRLARLLCGLCILSVLLGTMVLVRGGSSPSPAAGQQLEDDPFSSFSLLGGEDGVAIVKVYGVIAFEQESGGFPGIAPFATGADRTVRILRKLRKMDRVKGIVLRINSPGGTVAASQEIFNQVKALVDDGKKVVVSMADVAASGGYYISAPASYVMANPGTLTGSIGVIASMTNYEGLLKMAGVRFEVIKSGKYKDMGAGYRKMSKEERALFEKVINGAWKQFVDAVAVGRLIEEERDGRRMVITSREQLEKLCQGQIFLGTEAAELGLVDEIGDFHKAIEKAGELCGLGKSPHLIRTSSGAGLERLFEMFDVKGPTLDPKALLPGNALPPLLYLYVPGRGAL